MKTLRALLCLAALTALYAWHAAAQAITLDGLRSSNGAGSFKAAQYAPDGSLILLYDQGDGPRLLKCDASATTLIAQAHLGAAGDAAVGLSLDPAGNIYIVGTEASGAITGTAGAVFPSPADSTTNSFLARFDSSLNLQFLTFFGAGKTLVAGVAATSDAVFVTGLTYSSVLPVTPAAVGQSFATGSTGNGFVQRFSPDGATLSYSTYLTGSGGDTVPATVAADSSDQAYVAGLTTAAGFPTSASALQPRMLGAASGFVAKLSPAGNGFVFASFIPGGGLTGIAFDSATDTLLLTGNVAIGQFPVTTVAGPVAHTPYQTLLRLSSDGQTLLDATLLVPGSSSSVTPGPAGTAWVSGLLGVPLWPSGAQPGAPFGDSFLLHVTSANTLDHAFRFGGLPVANVDLATLTSNIGVPSVSKDGSAVALPGTLAASVSQSVLSSQRFDVPLAATPNALLPGSTADLSLGPCSGQQCTASSAFLATVATQPGTGTVLSLATGDAPNLTLRNVGAAAATGIVVTATGYTVASNCGTALTASGQCELALNGGGPGTISISAQNAPAATATIPSTTRSPDAVISSTAELDFGIVTGGSPVNRTLTVTNLSNTPQSFTSAPDAAPLTPPYSLSEVATTCGQTSGLHLIPAASSCTVTLQLAALASAAADAPVSAFWTIGTRDIAVTGITQTAPLAVSASEIDFGIRFDGVTPSLPRYLYLSNPSADAVQHASVSLPSSSPFAVTDHCPAVLAAGSVCQIELTYTPPNSPSEDSATLNLDEGLSVLITGAALPASAATGAGTDPALTLSPLSINFGDPVVPTDVSSEIQAVAVRNTGAVARNLAISVTGDFVLTNQCGAILQPASTCLLLLQFAPSQPGLREGLLAVSTSPGLAPAYLSLTGRGSSLIAAANGVIDLGATYVGEPEVAWFRIQSPVTMLTASVADIGFGVAVVPDNAGSHGTVSASEFAPTVTAPCPDCWLAIQFQPRSAGSFSTSLALSSAIEGKPYQLNVTAEAQPVEGLVLTPANPDFGSVPVGSTSPPVTFTLANLLSPGAPVSVQSVRATGDFTLLQNATGGPSCSGVVTSTASCYLQVSFVPTAIGTRSGALTVITSSGTASAKLTGTGLASDALIINPASITFANQPGPAASEADLTLTNNSASSLTIGTIASSNPGFTAASTCAALASGVTCTVRVSFTPGASLTSGTLTIPVSWSTGAQTASTLYTVPLTGAYTATQAGLLLLPTGANFGAQTTATLGQTREFVLTNTSAMTQAITISAPPHFPLATPSECATLAAGASCRFAVIFLPQAGGALTGSLSVSAASATGTTSQAISYLQGYGTGSNVLTITGPDLRGSAMDFGQVTSGQFAMETLTLTNTGTGTLHLRRISTTPPFAATTTCAQPLSAGSSCTVSLSYSPIEDLLTAPDGAIPQPQAGTLTVQSDALSSPDVVTLAATVLPATSSSPGATVRSYTPSQGAVTFANTVPGTTSGLQTLVLTNTGSATVTFGTITASPEFQAATTCTTLLPSEGCKLTVSFTPAATSASAAHIGTLEIPSNALNALEHITLLGMVSPSPLTASPTTLNFGAVAVGRSGQLGVTLTNTASLPIPFGQITLPASYSIDSTSCPAVGDPLAAGQSCTLILSFTPALPGSRSDTLLVNTSATAAPIAIALTGTGLAPQLQITPATLVFGDTAIGSSSTLALTLSNTSATALTGIAATITGPNAGDFAAPSGCASATLQAGSTCSLQISFTPSAMGSQSATLVLSSSDPYGPAAIALSGTGTEPGSFVLTANGTSTATGTVNAGGTAHFALTLTPLRGYTGPVALSCAPVDGGPYSLCSVTDSEVTLGASVMTSTATVTTTIGLTASSTLLLLGPALLYRRRRRGQPKALYPVVLCTAACLCAASFAGCGGTATTAQLVTPPGTYQYRVTANSLTGPAVSSTATLTVIVQ